MHVDWTFKVSDVIKILVLAALAILSYEHLSNRVQMVEQDNAALKAKTDKTDEVLQAHIQREAELAAKAVEVMNRMLQTMESFPPHRHTGAGEIIYPTLDSKPIRGKP